MKFKFPKKNKVVSLEDLHKSPYSPKKDWLIMTACFSALILIAIIISAVSFYDLLYKDESVPSGDTESTLDPVEIDTKKIESAVDFINSRTKTIQPINVSTSSPTQSVLPAGIEPTSKP